MTQQMPVFRQQIRPEALGIDTLAGQKLNGEIYVSFMISKQYIYRGNLEVSDSPPKSY